MKPLEIQERHCYQGAGAKKRGAYKKTIHIRDGIVEFHYVTEGPYKLNGKIYACWDCRVYRWTLKRFSAWAKRDLGVMP